MQGFSVAQEELEKRGHVGAVPHAVEKGFRGAEIAVRDETAGETKVANDHFRVFAGFAAAEAQTSSVRQDDQQAASSYIEERAERHARKPGDACDLRDIRRRHIETVGDGSARMHAVNGDLGHASLPASAPRL